MSNPLYARIRRHSRFTELVTKRNRLTVRLFVAILVVFYGYMGLVTLWPELIGRRLSETSNLTFGVVAGMFLFVFFCLLAGLYVYRANGEFDRIARVIKKGTASEGQELRVTKFATLGLGVIAIGLGIVFENTNVSFMVALAFGIAASANFPVLFLSMFWRGLTTRGALAGGYLGLVSAIAFVVLSKSVWVDVFGFAEAVFPYTQPALFSMPLAFLSAIVVSRLDDSVRAKAEQAAFDDQYIRGQTGIGASVAAAH
ncbi:sodium:solute symporter family transporter [Azotobacter salinestris]|uniref:sodium:solute symporter family transporter n=1 Tax=Azotobacter salinestris TaxID=69964 RepID=UPI001266C016|nr:DUF485 domain-containing protein [Azotobacter salinestris]